MFWHFPLNPFQVNPLCVRHLKWRWLRRRPSSCQKPKAAPAPAVSSGLFTEQMRSRMSTKLRCRSKLLSKHDAAWVQVVKQVKKAEGSALTAAHLQDKAASVRTDNVSVPLITAELSICVFVAQRAAVSLMDWILLQRRPFGSWQSRRPKWLGRRRQSGARWSSRGCQRSDGLMQLCRPVSPAVHPFCFQRIQALLAFSSAQVQALF